MSAAHPHAAQPSSDIEARIEGSGCSAQFYALEECLGEHSRAFSACQPHVQAWKACSAAAAAAATATAATAGTTTSAAAQKPLPAAAKPQ